LGDYTILNFFYPKLHSMIYSMRILGIETSCDETSLAIVEAKGGLKNPQFKIIKNLIHSQIPIHREFGGVVPNLAKREHTKNLPILLKKLTTHNPQPTTDLIAVTVGPGLDPALWTGIEFAKDLAKKIKKPLIGVNHLEGHIYSSWIQPTREIKNHKPQVAKVVFPAIALIVSGGHTILLHMTSLTKWKKLGETRDDAAGEAFDKVARMLKLPYPGGPEIEKIAQRGNDQAINFPRPMLREKNYEFSFSGLKTSVLYHLRDHKTKIENQNQLEDIAASFQKAVVDVLVSKTIRAVQEHRAKSVLLAGGVAANKFLRRTLKKEARLVNAKFITPSIRLNTDNAAMIAVAGYVKHLTSNRLAITSQPNLTL
jgi:N6-L-threonylcarbamoyladenine synthase